ncbi:MAG: hypothetical protein JXA09_07200, partial [Anaerolineae bacterium]|nr:hypothetical protein [Anaerolineae bacterium]
VVALMLTGVLPNMFVPTAQPAPVGTVRVSTPTSTATTALAPGGETAPTETSTTAPPPPTATGAPPAAPTATSVPPTATTVPPTATSVPPTATTAPPTATTEPPTATSVPPTATPTETPLPTATATAPPQPLTISHVVDEVACLSKAQYRIRFTIYVGGGTGQYEVYRDIDEQKIYGPGPQTAIEYELTWGADASAVGTLYVRSGGERVESKFYVPNPDCSGM